jgi:hypothetical protein
MSRPPAEDSRRQIVLNHPPSTAQNTTARPAVVLTTGAVRRWRTTSSTADTAVTAARDCSGVPSQSTRAVCPRRTTPSPLTVPTYQEQV